MKLDKALAADGEKLRALTGQDHGPWSVPYSEQGLRPEDFIRAARVPHSIKPGDYGPWTIERRQANDSILAEMTPRARSVLASVGYGMVGFPDYTLLRRHTIATLQQNGGEVVMEDSWRELQRHLPIWLEAKGRVLITGLGLGCVVRGLLLNPEVEAIDVVELDPRIIALTKPTLDDPRVMIVQGDALKVAIWGEWDYAWHDLWCEPSADGSSRLQMLHAALMAKYRDHVRFKQGAWMFPRWAMRTVPASKVFGGKLCR